MVGEIRDRETAHTAYQAALTGHRVLTTLHTNDAPSAITRFIELGVEPYLIRSGLLAVVAQRLVRTLCPHCRRPGPVDAGEWHALVAPSKVAPPRRAFASPGCDECRHTGFRGRLGIFEILTFDDEMRRLVTESPDLAAIRAHGLATGMRSLRASGAAKVAAGLTTPAEVLMAVQD
jgi:general secretion pathway protein E